MRLEAILERVSRRIGQLSFEERFQIIHAFVQRVVIHTTGAVEIHAFPPTEHGRSMVVIAPDSLALFVRQDWQVSSGQVANVRRIVREYVHTAIARAKPVLEQYIAQHLRYPEPFPFTLTDVISVIDELRGERATARFTADYPPVDVTVALHILLTARTRRRDVDLGLRTFTADVEVRALGTVQGDGYTIVPQEAQLTAWWGHSPAAGSGRS